MASRNVSGSSNAGERVLTLEPDVVSPFGTYAPGNAGRRLLNLAQNAPRNPFGKQLARVARSLFLRRQRLPADVCVEGLRLRCYLRDNTGERKFVFTPWRFDAPERAEIARSLPPAGVFVDIGANVGLYTLSAAMHLGTSGRIVAIEPFEPACRRLRYNIAATQTSRENWPRIDVLQIGVSDREETRELRVDEGNLGGGSIIAGDARFSPAGPVRARPVLCRRLLDVLVEQQVKRVDVIKIDVEGAEDLALCPFLRAAPAPLLPRRIILENSEHLWREDLHGALVARGYARLLRTKLNSIYGLETAAG